MKYSRPRTGPTYCSYGTHGAVRTSWRKLSHGADSRVMAQLIIRIIGFSSRPVSRLCESNLRIGPYHLVDNALGPAGNVRKSRTHVVSNDT